MTVRFLGVDLACGEGSEQRPANRSGVVALERDGTISDAGCTIGLPDTFEWIERAAGTEDVLLFVDAPLVIAIETGQRLCERNVGQRYGSFWVSANSTNRASPRQTGVVLRERLRPPKRPPTSSVRICWMPALRVDGLAVAPPWIGALPSAWDGGPAQRRRRPPGNDHRAGARRTKTIVTGTSA